MEQRQAANREASSRHSHSPGPQAPATAARLAIKQWGRVDRRVRQALKRASPALLFDLEWRLLDPLLEVRDTLQHSCRSCEAHLHEATMQPCLTERDLSGLGLCGSLPWHSLRHGVRSRKQR